MSVRNLLAAGAVALLLNPWIIEGADNNCAAYETQIVRTIMVKNNLKINMVGGVTNGRFAQLVAPPDLPLWLYCSYAYWHAAVAGID